MAWTYHCGDRGGGTGGSWRIFQWSVDFLCCSAFITQHTLQYTMQVFNKCLKNYGGHLSHTINTTLWLRLSERVDFKVVVMAYRVLHGLAPPYLSQLARVADLPSRRRLRSSVGRRSFPVAAAILWNSLICIA